MPCAKFWLTHKNLSEATKSTSKYKELSWNKERKRWQVEFDFNGKKSKYYFENKFDAIKTRNRFHKKMGIPEQNHEICEIPNQQVTPIQMARYLRFVIEN